MSGPRIVKSQSSGPSFSGDVPPDLSGLRDYTRGEVDDGPRETDVRRRSMPIRTIVGITACLVVVTCIAAIAVVMVRMPFGGSSAPKDEPAVAAVELNVAGNVGADQIRCMGDILTVTLSGVDAGDGVVVAWLDAANGSLEIVLKRTESGYAGHVYAWMGVTSTDFARPAHITIWPGERFIVRVGGVLQAREVFVAGEGVRLGSRGDETCT